MKNREAVIKPSQRKWRIRLRVLCVDRDDVWIVMPGWNTRVAVYIPKDIFPKEMHKHLFADARFHAQVNMGAERPEDLVFSNFELASEPDPKIG